MKALREWIAKSPHLQNIRKGESLNNYNFYVPEQRRILCTLYGAVDFLIVSSKDLYGWGGPEQGD